MCFILSFHIIKKNLYEVLFNSIYILKNIIVQQELLLVQ